MALIADRLGVRLTLSGQTLGPTLTRTDALALREALRPAVALGFRDSSSVARAAESVLDASTMHRMVPVLDDASFLSVNASSSPEEVPAQRVGEVVVTLSPDALAPFQSPEEGAAVFAALLNEVCSSTGQGVTFVPHMATPGEGDGDEAVHALVARAMRTGDVLTHRVVDVESARRAVRSAALVISSRFHPVVFALAEGRPAVGLCASGYAFRRIQGAFENWGLSGFALPVDAVLDPHLVPGVADVLNDTGVLAHLAEAEPALRAFSDQWWDHLLSASAGDPVASPSIPRPPTYEAPAPLLLAARRLRVFARRAQASEAALAELDRADSVARVLEDELRGVRSSLLVRAQARLGRLRRGVGDARR